jgi:hypothetical protein
MTNGRTANTLNILLFFIGLVSFLMSQAYPRLPAIWFQALLSDLPRIKGGLS